MALISDYSIPFDVLNCVIACSEYIYPTGDELPGEALGSLRDSFSSGMISINGSLQISEDLRPNDVQNVLRRLSYTNTHPYPLPGVRYVSYTIYDGSVKLTSPADIQVIVLYHGYRSLQLLRVSRRTATMNDVKSGINLFSSVGITTDSRSDRLDSLLVELTSTPQSQSSCFRLLGSSSTSNCPRIFSLDPQVLGNTSLQVITKANKLILYGLSNVATYQMLLHQIIFQSATPLNSSRQVLKSNVVFTSLT